MSHDYDYHNTPPMDEETYPRLLDTFLPSEEMREYLKKEPMLHEGTILDLITGAPVPLSEKVKWAWGDFKVEAEKALDELTLRPGELLTLSDAWYDEDIRENKLWFNSPYLSFEKAQNHIRGEMAEYGDDWYDCQWYVLEKWIPAGEGELDRSYEGIYLEPSKLTLSDWLDIWLKEYTFDKKYSTVKGYKAQIKKHIRPGLGKYNLSQINPMILQRFFNNLSQPDDEGNILCPKSIKNVHIIFSGIMQQAVENEMIAKNPCKKVKLPKVFKKDIVPLKDA